MSAYERTAGPPISKTPPTGVFSAAALDKYQSTSRIAIGCVRFETHFGVVMTGKRCVKCRSISKDAEPEPIIIPARISITGTFPLANWRPVFARDSRCWLICLSFAIPPR